MIYLTEQGMTQMSASIKNFKKGQSTWKTFEPSQIVDATFTFGSVSNLEHLEKH